MRIFRALKPNNLTHKFGEILPVWTNIGMKGHNGFDFSAPLGEKIYWDCDIRGTVLNTEIDSKGGLGVNVISEDKDGIFKHRFWHLQKFNCIAGQILESGDLIGYADTTGLAFGSHLHRDLKPMIKDQNEAYKIKNYNNGYFGATDIQPFFTNIFIKDYVANLEGQVSVLKQIIEKINELLKLKVGY